MKKLKLLLVAAFIASTILNLLLLSSPVYNGSYESQVEDSYGDHDEIIFNDNVATYNTIYLCSVRYDGDQISAYYRDWYTPERRIEMSFNRVSVFKIEERIKYNEYTTYICKEAITKHIVYSLVMISTACAFIFVEIKNRRNKYETTDSMDQTEETPPRA